MEHDAPAPQRLLSLDAFRGLVIVLMFLVNVAGHDPAFPAWFPHRGWNEGRMGNGLADFVFPWFLFIVGAAIPLSLASGRGKGRSARRILLDALARAGKIYLLGTLLHCAAIAYDQPITWRVILHWDILPLIALAYLIGVALTLGGRWALAAWVVAALAFKWAILTRVTYPGEDAVVWTAGRSVQSYLRAQLGWSGVALTQGSAAAAVVALGALSTMLLRAPLPAARRAAFLAGAGLLGVALSYAWHRWGGLPYSKDFFTSSYVLVTAGSGAAMLALMYAVIDVRRWCTMAFLRVMGMNALACYILAEFLWKTVLTRWKAGTPDGSPSMLITAWKAWMQEPLGDTLGSWAHVAGYIMLYWLVAYALYRQRIFIKV